ncbi:MAG: hypothetical protein EI684_17170 [Candidatus Viridilinea halotolerans]|uniref:VWA domain-containing protein n=1 Tax=Candidatus Viridilinea halotolerans TaxID=2491704 RepID=A0A426TUE6_9CHLR|nr:MAG: hypothetical protein EI684_17170 [Candidatus Viridilinea halotolerans]
MRAKIHLLALLALLTVLLMPTTLGAQAGTPQLRIADIDTSQFPTLQLAVNVSDTSGNPLPAPSAFAVTINGAPVEGISVVPTRRQVAVVMVSDLSSRMSDRGTGFSRRFDDMLPRIKALTDQLRTAGHYASLITFDSTVQVAHALTYDLGAVSNTLNRGNSALIFEPAANGGDNYPLVEALLAGVEQLVAADPTMPLALVLFAAGEPSPTEVGALRQQLDELRAAGRPVRLLVIGFGSDNEGEYNEFPAGPGSLRQLAEEDLNGTFIGVGIEPLDETTRREIEAQFTALGNLANQYNLTLSASDVPSGEATIAVSADGASDSVSFDPGEIPPRFDVIVDTRSFQDEVRIAINTSFQQAELERVEYFLSDMPLATVTEGPEFIFRLEAYDATFQQQFPPGDYVLSAAAFDTNGNHSRSTNTIPMTVFSPPPPPTLLETAMSYWWVVLIVVALGGLAISGFMRPRQRRVVPIFTKGDPPTVEHGAQGDLTMQYQPPADAPQEYQPTGIPTKRFDKRWFVEVIEGDDDRGKRFELNEGRHFNIGRSSPSEHPPEFLMASPLVTKGGHARLSLLHNGIELVAGASRNGTFVGNDQRELLANSHHILRDNDVFWLSRGVKLRVVKEDV